MVKQILIFTCFVALVCADCIRSSNDAAAAATEITVNYDTPSTFDLTTCDVCQPADFAGVNFSDVPGDTNVFWFSIPAQTDAYHLTLSSDSFDGFTDAFIWVFGSDGNLITQAINIVNNGAILSLDVDEDAIRIAFGAECFVNFFSLQVAFSTRIEDLIIVVNELDDSFTEIFNNGVADVIDQVETTESNLETAIDQEFDDIDTLATDQFVEVDTSIAGISQDIGDHETAIVDRVNTRCGETGDSIDSLYASNNERWSNYRNKEIIDFLVVGSTVPVLYSTPASQNGKMGDVLTFVTDTYNSKKQFADSQRTGNTCPPSSYCDFFYKFPANNGANSAYQGFLTTYNLRNSQGRWKTAFQQLSNAYNALFMGQSV